MINVVCAVIFDSDGRVLVCRRSEEQAHAGKWEFPGGKVEAGEPERDALAREILEELGCEIEVGERLPVVDYDYPGFSVRLIPYGCKIRNGFEPKPLEHETVKWIELGSCPDLDWAEADVPVWEGVLADAS